VVCGLSFGFGLAGFLRSLAALVSSLALILQRKGSTKSSYFQISRRFSSFL
jgi:hypothetical protein